MSLPDAALQNPRTEPTGDAAGGFIMGLQELDECRRGGLVTDEDFAYQRAEKLDQFMAKKPRRLWLGWWLACLPLALAGGDFAWWLTQDWWKTALAAGIAGTWGLAALGRLACEQLRNYQLRERLGILRELLALDLVSSVEFAAFEEQLDDGHPTEV